MDSEEQGPARGTRRRIWGLDEPARSSQDTNSASDARLEQHTKLFASMCPDEILDYYDDYGTRAYQTTLMLGDVSGFTDLAERYSKTDEGGPSKLTETLNSYIGAMVQEILSHNGDVLKFSGDAFIVMWKLKEGTTIRDLAIEAIQTACTIQKHFGTYNTDVGVTLRVKLAIASGRTYFTSIGSPETMSYYIITGKPVWDVKFAETLCRGGDILVTSSSWQWANPHEYVYEVLPDGEHILIIACSNNWYYSRINSVANNVEDDENDHTGLPRTGSDLSIASGKIDPYMDIGVIPRKMENTLEVDYSLRPKVIKVAKAKLKDALRSYMLRPVVRSVEMNEPLEYLTEMRQVVILFTNVIISAVGTKRLISLVDAAYKLVCAIVGKMQGCVNKTSLFDKDLAFLCIFGLRGDKHELESQIGLKCATKVRESLLAIKNVESVSIGVTTGLTYCGVVGHILRREYTVIGMSVNKAARLMCVYRDKVVCDQESFLHSHLEARHFVLQEPKHLKGITNVGPVYEFQEHAKYQPVDLLWNKYPLLGRDTEISVFCQMLASLLKYNNLEATKRGSKPVPNTLIIKGEPRIGKTRLLDEITQNIPAGMACNYISLVKTDTQIAYSLIRLIFYMPLGLTATSSRKEREDRLISRLGKVRKAHLLCALNEPFNVRFMITHRYKALNETEKKKVLRRFLTKLAKMVFSELWVILVDDIEYGDEESLELFDAITEADTAFFVVSVGRKLTAGYKINAPLLARAKAVNLLGIDKWYHAGLACQVLNVDGIPAELEKRIQERSSGNPGWIESYLVSLLQAGRLVIINITKKEADLQGYVLPPLVMLDRFISQGLENVNDVRDERTDRWQMYSTSYRDSAVSMLHKDKESKSRGIVRPRNVESDETMIAVCKESENFLSTDLNTEITMDVMILKLFDSLSPLDQLLLKCASVLGEMVNREMLESLMDVTPKRDIGVAICKLFEIRVFGCGVGDFSADQSKMFLRNVRTPCLEAEIHCWCTGLNIRKELLDLPKYASCGLMRFKTSIFRDTMYRLLTGNQKIELHSKALKYLKQNTRRCAACGGIQFSRLLGNRVTVYEDKLRRTTSIEQIVNGTRIADTTCLTKLNLLTANNELTRHWKMLLQWA